MPEVMTNCDAIREYLTGASSNGAAQPDVLLSLGGFRASDIADSLQMTLESPIKGIRVIVASSSNITGAGVLAASNPTTLTWQPHNAELPGTPEEFTLEEADERIIEGTDASQFLRVQGTPPFSVGSMIVTLREVLENALGFDNIASADGVAGITHYWATIIKNVSQSDVSTIQRWINQLGTASVSSQGQLGGSGAGTITASTSLADWPTAGWCQVRNAGAIREVVYYTSRTLYDLTVPSAGRALLGTSAAAGASTDTIHSVPGIALALSVAGAQSAGAAMATIANVTTAPAGVTWNLGITAATGLQVPRLAPSQHIGIWVRRHIPAGVIFAPNVYNRTRTKFVVN